MTVEMGAFLSFSFSALLDNNYQNPYGHRSLEVSSPFYLSLKLKASYPLTIAIFS